MNNYEIKRSSSIKFLGVLVDENLTWVDYITTLENKDYYIKQKAI